MFVTGYDSNAKEVTSEQEYYYDWSRFKPITDVVDFRRLLNSYRQYLVMSGKAIKEIKEVANEMIETWEKITNTQFVE